MQNTNGQEGLPIYSDYLTDNYYLIHPSMAGAAYCAQIRTTARRNWVGQEDAPGLFTLAYNQRVARQSAIGAQFFSDRNGYTSQSGGYVTYAHHLMFSRSEADLNMLSFGLSAGFLQYRLDQSEFIINDPLITSSSVSNSEFNLDIGASYHLFEFYAHFTAKNLLENSGINNDLQVTSNLRTYLLSMGYTFNRPNKGISYEPSIMLMNREGLNDTSIDFNFKLHKDMSFGKIYGGLSYRTSLNSTDVIVDGELQSQNLSILTPFFGAHYKRFKFAYTYSYQSNSLVFNNAGFHQITLGLDFSCREKQAACYCPL